MPSEGARQRIDAILKDSRRFFSTGYGGLNGSWVIARPKACFTFCSKCFAQDAVPRVAKGTDDEKPYDYTLWFSDTYVRTPRGSNHTMRKLRGRPR